MLDAAPSLGPLPEWNLSDLYESGDSPTFKDDLKRGRSDAEAFAARYKGKLAEIAAAADGGERLAEALKDYEALDELLGRIGSYAQLHYVGDTTDPKRAKFYGDVTQALTDISVLLLFFELELNRIADATMETALQAPGFARYKPWIDDLRKERPYQLDDRIEQLFQEKSVTGYSAWNRLFDETMADLKFEVEGRELLLEPTLNLLLDPDENKRRAASDGLAKTFRANLRLFAHITNTLAKDKEISDRWRGFKDIADARHLSNRIEPEVVDALVKAVREAFPRCRTDTTR